MKITRIKATNIKIPLIDEAIEPGRILPLAGPNQTGKTAVLDALMIGLFGHVPAAGKTNKATAQFVRRGAGNARVEVETNLGTFIRDIAITKTGSIKITSTVPEELTPEPWLFSAEAYASATDKARFAMVLDALGGRRLSRTWGQIEGVLAEGDAIIPGEIELSDCYAADTRPTIDDLACEIVEAKERLKSEKGLLETATKSKKGLAYVEANADDVDIEKARHVGIALNDVRAKLREEFVAAQMANEAWEGIKDVKFDPETLEVDLAAANANRSKCADEWRSLTNRKAELEKDAKRKVELETKLGLVCRAIDETEDAIDDADEMTPAHKERLTVLEALTGVLNLVDDKEPCPCCGNAWDRQALLDERAALRAMVESNVRMREGLAKIEDLRRIRTSHEEELTYIRKRQSELAKTGQTDLEILAGLITETELKGKEWGKRAQDLANVVKAIEVANRCNIPTEDFFAGKTGPLCADRENQLTKINAQIADAKLKEDAALDVAARRRTWEEFDKMEAEAARRIPVLKAMVEGLEAISNEAVVNIMAPLIEEARELWPLTGELDLIGTEFVIRHGENVVTWDVMSGAERLAVGTAIKVALSQFKIVIIDEMAVLDPAVRETFVEKLQGLLDSGKADTVITVMPTR